MCNLYQRVISAFSKKAGERVERHCWFRMGGQDRIFRRDDGEA